MPVMYSKLSRNSNKKDLIHFSVFTNTFNNETDTSSNLCHSCKIQEWMKDQLDYDQNKLIENRDMIKQILCIGCNKYLTAKEFLLHIDSCRSLSIISKQELKLGSSKSQMIKTRLIQDKFNCKSKMGNTNRNNDPSPMETRASGISPSSRIISKFYGSPQNSICSKTKNVFSNSKSISSMKPLESNICTVSSNTPDCFKKLKMHAANSRVNSSKNLKESKSPLKSKQKKTILIQLEDEDIVNREESFMTDDNTKAIDQNKQVDANFQSNEQEQRLSFESMKRSESSILDLYYTNQNRSISSKFQPQGDEEDEIIFE